MGVSLQAVGMLVGVEEVDAPSGGFVSSLEPEPPPAALSVQAAAAAYWESLSTGKQSSVLTLIYLLLLIIPAVSVLHKL